jgi:hypothetical protein
MKDGRGDLPRFFLKEKVSALAGRTVKIRDRLN